MDDDDNFDRLTEVVFRISLDRDKSESFEFQQDGSTYNDVSEYNKNSQYFDGVCVDMLILYNLDFMDLRDKNLQFFLKLLMILHTYSVNVRNMKME